MTITEKIDATTQINHYQSAPPAPRSVKIELTGRCNYRCGFCALRTRKEQPKGDMDFDLFRRITVDMVSEGVKEIGLFYLGESFMNPRLLVAAIRHCKDIGVPYVFLTTNGSLATPNVVKDCMEAGLDSLKFSINAGDSAQFKDVMGVAPKNYDRALDNLRTAHALRDAGGYQCGLYASSIQYDGEQQAKMENLIESRVRPWVDEHYWLPLYSMGSLATAREAELGFKPTAGNQGRLGALREPLPCWSAFTEGHVTADGYLSACCFDADSRWKMGDLNTQTFMEAWHSAAFVALREAHLRKDVKGTPCEECVAYA